MLSSTCSPPRQPPSSLLCRTPAYCRSPELPSPSSGFSVATQPQRLGRRADGLLISEGSGNGGERLAMLRRLTSRQTRPRPARQCRSTRLNSFRPFRRPLRKCLASKFPLRLRRRNELESSDRRIRHQTLDNPAAARNACSRLRRRRSGHSLPRSRSEAPSERLR